MENPYNKKWGPKQKIHWALNGMRVSSTNHSDEVVRWGGDWCCKLARPSHKTHVYPRLVQALLGQWSQSSPEQLPSWVSISLNWSVQQRKAQNHLSGVSLCQKLSWPQTEVHCRSMRPRESGIDLDKRGNEEGKQQFLATNLCNCLFLFCWIHKKPLTGWIMLEPDWTNLHLIFGTWIFPLKAQHKTRIDNADHIVTCGPHI